MLVENPKQILVDYKGEPVPQAVPSVGPNGEQMMMAGSEPLTFRDAVFLALNYGTEQHSAEEKLRSFKITTALFASGGPVELTAEDVAWIKEQAGRVLSSPLVYGRIVEIIEQTPRLAALDSETA